ncbi:unnamed protein product [Kuraishia capsulata CBS 1993]|uniref:TauD/TfdA-like domain-containing protein n=1 Tax=Kuraishia capsulata CBS 1993 TaxID=1382522 RepID=W6MR91_9ASCO|nr:uncharacterized protein KUCA_T00005234001 [Kuraishia capsulata CBS 1993]CDK29246.1 unnamed protein product [Kuraishia capsulata CBS 1993]
MPAPAQDFQENAVINGIQVSLQAVSVPNQQIVHGNVFPLALIFTSSDISNRSATEQFLKDLSSKGVFTELLNKHGAVLLRGLGDSSADGFSAFVNGIEKSRGRVPFEQIGLAGKRHNWAENVFTANEGPPEARFFQHNEYARYTHFPANIHFFCNKAAQHGGGSPIAHSAMLFERIQNELPHFIKELSEKRLINQQVYPSRTFSSAVSKGNEFYWEDPDSFGHEINPEDSIETKRTKAEKMIRRLTDDFHWNEDGSVTLKQHVPAFRQHPVTGKPTFFNGVVGRYGTAKSHGALEPPHRGSDGGFYLPNTYDNGEPIPFADLDRALAISRELEFVHAWEEGDLVLVDNYQVSHGREPWKRGEERVVLVSMWDEVGPKPKEWTV